MDFLVDFLWIFWWIFCEFFGGFFFSNLKMFVCHMYILKNDRMQHATYLKMLVCHTRHT